jgi:hypothetical protein
MQLARAAADRLRTLGLDSCGAGVERFEFLAI